MKKFLAILLLLTAGGLSVTGTFPASTRSATAEEEAWSRTNDHADTLPETGAIEGHVLNAEGQPVPNTLVFLEGVGVIMRGLPSTTTDNEGRFLLKNVPPGTYLLHGKNEKAGYPSTIFSFARTAPDLPQVSVQAAQVISGVTLNLGNKAARLTGRVRDIITGKSIKQPRVTLRRADNPGLFYSTLVGADGAFEILVPATSITVEVSAQGYETWRYKARDTNKRQTNSAEFGDALRVTPEGIKNLIVTLQPMK